MLLDKITLNIKAGKGGDGVVRWRREKGIPFGGPAGGDGGKGGDVYVRAIRDVYALARYKTKREITAQEGESGFKRSMHGKNGKDIIIDMPVGSVMYNRDYDITYDLSKEGELIKILKGGKGGLGNENFKTATNRTPEEYTKGQLGEEGAFDVELRLIADVGFVGKPNAGKSSLLNALTRASAKVADYPFTTLEPNLGAYHNYILADIPGLIEGASEGKGLGHKFLKHIRRTSALVHLVAADEEDHVATYKQIKNELNNFDKELIDKKELLILSKIDLIDKSKIKEIQDRFKKELNLDIKTLTVLDDASVKMVGDDIVKMLAN